MTAKRTTTRLSTVVLLGALSGAAFQAAALADPIDHADPKHGKQLHDAACTSCHKRMYGGDAGAIYTQPGRMISDRTELLQRVALCVSRNHLGWFPDDEADVARYLNDTYYHFPR